MMRLILITVLSFFSAHLVAQNNKFPVTGNVGVGTSSPSSLLQVAGIASFRSTVVNDGYLTINPGGATSQGYINWFKPGNLRVAYLGYTDGITANNLGLTLEEANFVINGGNVGVGTTDPGSRKLKVITSSSANDVGAEISITRTIGNNYGLISEAGGVGADINTGVFATAGGGNINYGVRIYNVQPATNNYALYSDSQAKSFFAGNVGIGTTTPSEKLSVNGSIRAKEIKVESNNWPDYVFADGYKLSPLSETAKHIREKGHLPGIPSASEVQANGVELGEMNKKLLEKIEELTLHLIEMKRESEQQRIEIEKLKSKIK